LLPAGLVGLLPLELSVSVPPTGLYGLDQFVVKQRLTMMVNRYEIRAVGIGGEDGPILALAQQKRMAFREQVTFYTDEARTRPVFSFKARQVMDLAGTYDVVDAGDRPIGSFRRDFGASLLRSTWHLETADLRATGRERSKTVAILRRLQNSIPLAYHFDFVDQNEQAVMSSERTFGLRDRYLVTVPGARLDSRVAAAMAVALDALQAR
jgi:uncharacterized protein YxjI